MVEVPAGACTIGAPATGFAYDNERPRHRTDVRGYLIGRTPITNASYLTFVEGGGYERREWWSDEGWAWKEEYDISRPGGWTADWRASGASAGSSRSIPHRPVVHVSWFEADAFARAHGARLPTETEWEKAATWDEITDPAPRARRYPWGDRAPRPRAAREPRPPRLRTGAGRRLSRGRLAVRRLGMIGDVWEWTSTGSTATRASSPTPTGSTPRCSSEADYRVLRGGSWATRAASRPRPSATGTTRSAARSSPA